MIKENKCSHENCNQDIENSFEGKLFLRCTWHRKQANREYDLYVDPLGAYRNKDFELD